MCIACPIIIVKIVKLVHLYEYPYIQKTGLAGWKILQKIRIFRKKIVSERENYQSCNVLEKYQQASSKTKVS